jgi:lipid A 3-O-deacylase
MVNFLEKKRFFGVLACAVFIASYTPPSQSADFSVLIGDGSDAAIVGLEVSSSQPLWERQLSGNWGEWTAKAHLIGSISKLDGKGRGANGPIVLGVTPRLELQSSRHPVYLEIGVGANYFDEKRIGESKQMGTHFQFGDLVGFGIRFPRSGTAIGYRFIHYSNAGISASNPGLDFHMLAIRAAF